jgi:hypothetical protein
LGESAIRSQVQTATGKQGRIDLVGIDELFQHEALFLRRPKLVQFGCFDNHVLTREIFVGSDDGLVRHLAMHRAVLLVTNPLPAVCVELIERDVFAGAHRRIRFDRHHH